MPSVVQRRGMNSLKDSSKNQTDQKTNPSF